MNTPKYILHGGPSTIYECTLRQVWRALRMDHTRDTARLLVHHLHDTWQLAAQWHYLGRAGNVITRES